jgi:hypothetical protein
MMGSFALVELIGGLTPSLKRLEISTGNETFPEQALTGLTALTELHSSCLTISRVLHSNIADFRSLQALALRPSGEGDVDGNWAPNWNPNGWQFS